MTFENAKAIWTKMEPYAAALLGMVKQCLAWAWTALQTVLKPFWVPAVTLARNPLTAAVVAIAVFVAYVAGDGIRALKDQNMLAAEKTASARVVKANNIEHMQIIIDMKAAAVKQAEADQKTIADLTAKLAAADHRKVAVKPVSAPAVKSPKSAWSLFD